MITMHTTYPDGATSECRLHLSTYHMLQACEYESGVMVWPDWPIYLRTLDRDVPVASFALVEGGTTHFLSVDDACDYLADMHEAPIQCLDEVPYPDDDTPTMEWRAGDVDHGGES